MSEQTYNYIAYAWILLGIITFIYLQWQVAPFGRHTTSGWGPLIDNRLGWFIMEFPVILVLLFFLYRGKNAIVAPIPMMIGFFLAHYIHRSIIFPLRIRTKGKKMPLAIVLSAIGFNLMNGFLLGYYFGNFAQYPSDWYSSPAFIAGTLVFITGAWINIRSDYRLIRLRKPNETGYTIPMGGMFRYISCPNLFGEILEWTGFAILTWSVPGLCFAVWTAANLLPRALAHHRWYLNQFSNYPLERKAVFPFIW